MAFAIDTGDTGTSQGPWITWSSNGSAMKGIPHSAWVLRGKDEQGMKSETAVPAFVNGCVMDIDSLKLGWEKDGATGQAPERKWNPSISHATPRPDESKRPGSEAFAWSRALSVRLAIGGGQAATWEQGSFGAYEAFSRLATQIQAQYPGDNTLPLIKQTGVERMQLKSGSTNIPLLTIERWVPRPDCLKAGAPVIAVAASAPPVQQTPIAAQTPPPASASVPADVAF